MTRTLARLAALLALAAPLPAVAAEAMYTYYPNNESARRLTDRGLTFVLEKGFLGGVLMTRIMATEAPAAADLAPAAERDLGVRLDGLIGKDAYERDLYLIKDTAQGPAMMRAFCPGSAKAWLAFGAVKPRRDVTVHAIGLDPVTGQPKLCTSMDFRFRGEWKLPGPEGVQSYRSFPDKF